jgi:CRP-like cAMP-binding protein
VLIGLGGPAAVYTAIAILTLCSTVIVLPLALAARPLVAATIVPRHGLLRELGAGLRTVIGDRRLFAVMAILSGAIALLGAFNVLLTVIAIDLLGGDESTIGYVAAIAGLGSVLGAGATSLLMGRERLATVYVLAGALFAGAVALIGLNPGTAAILACVVAAGVGWAFVYVEALTLAQRLAGDDVMSRVFGIMEATMMASQALGALLVAVLIATVGVTSAMVASGLAFGVVVALAAPTLIRADRLVPSRVRQLQALRSMPMFGPLSAPVLERLATGATTISVDAGRRIITQGEIGDRFYVILSGDVDITTAAGVHRTEGRGDSFGEIALLRDIPRTATVTAVGPTELLAVDRGPFLEALTGQPRSRALAEAESRRRLDTDTEADLLAAPAARSAAEVRRPPDRRRYPVGHDVRVRGEAVGVAVRRRHLADPRHERRDVPGRRRRLLGHDLHPEP